MLSAKSAIKRREKRGEALLELAVQYAVMADQLQGKWECVSTEFRIRRATLLEQLYKAGKAELRARKKEG